MDKDSKDFKLLKRLILNYMRYYDSTFTIISICKRNGYLESDIIHAYNDLLNNNQIIKTEDNRLIPNVDLN